MNDNYYFIVLNPNMIEMIENIHCTIIPIYMYSYNFYKRLNFEDKQILLLDSYHIFLPVFVCELGFFFVSEKSGASKKSKILLMKIYNLIIIGIKLRIY